jgi:hypothetical protein
MWAVKKKKETLREMQEEDSRYEGESVNRSQMEVRLLE